MNKKTFLRLLVVVLIVCATISVLTACNKNMGNEPSDYKPGDYKPGDTIVSEKDVTYEVDAAGNIIGGKYEGKDIKVKYLLPNASYVVLSGTEIDDLSLVGRHGDVKAISLKEIEDKVKIGGKSISVTSVAACAFKDCDTLETVDLTKSKRAVSFEVGEQAFANCISLKSVVMPTNLYVNDNTIDEGAFANCKKLTDVSLGEQFTDIGRGAFINCLSLETIQLPVELKYIRDYTFFGCKSLRYVTFAENATASDIFTDSDKLPIEAPTVDDEENNDDNKTDVATQNLALRSIGQGAFGYTDFQDGDFTRFANLRYIGESAFERTAITELFIPDNVTTIEDKAFFNCSSLKKVNIPFLGMTIANTNDWTFDSVYGIEDEYYHEELDVTVRATAKIPARAFYNSDVTKVSVAYTESFDHEVYGVDGFVANEVVLNDIDISVPEYAFANCISLKEVELDKLPFSIGNYAFASCIAIEQLPVQEVCSIGSYAFLDCTSIEEIQLPTTLTAIYNNAFEGCVAIEAIEIPSSVSIMGDEVFKDCLSLASIKIDSFFYEHKNEEGEITDIGAVVENLGKLFASTSNYYYNFENEAESLLYAATGAMNRTFIPKTLKTVELGNLYYLPQYAFDGFAGLTDIKLTFVDYLILRSGIEEYAFYNCKNLTNLTISDENNTITTIGDYAYYGCEGIDNIVISEHIESIGNFAFAKTGITEFVIPATIDFYLIGHGILADCINLASIEIKDYDTYDTEIWGVDDLGNTFSTYKTFGNITRLFDTDTQYPKNPTVEEGTSEEEFLALYPMYELSDSNYWAPRALKTIKLGSATKIAANAFAGFSCVENIEIAFDNTLKYYFANEYDYNESNYVAQLGYAAFKNCTGLKNLTFVNGEDVVIAGAEVFVGCASLKTLPIAIPKAPAAQGMLRGCIGLEELTVALPNYLDNWYLANLFASSTAYDNSLLNWSHANLRKVTLVGEGNDPNSSFRVPANMFNGARNISSVEFYTYRVNSIGSNAFRDAGITPSSDGHITTYRSWVIAQTSNSSFIEVPSSVVGFADGVVNYNVNKVFFVGQSEAWSQIRKGSNSQLDVAKVRYYSESAPIDDSNDSYWYYNLDGNPVVWKTGVAYGVITYRFDFGEGHVVPVSVEGDQNVTTSDIPSAPQRENFVLQGWYFDADCTEEVTFPFKRSEGVTLYAKWYAVRDGRYELESVGSYTFENVGEVYASNNKNVDNSTAKLKLVALETITVSFNWSVSSESTYDKLNVAKYSASNNRLATVVADKSGSYNGSVSQINLDEGEYLLFTYSKDGSQSNGDDCATVSNICAIAMDDGSDNNDDHKTVFEAYNFVSLHQLEHDIEINLGDVVNDMEGGVMIVTEDYFTLTFYDDNTCKLYFYLAGISEAEDKNVYCRWTESANGYSLFLEEGADEVEATCIDNNGLRLVFDWDGATIIILSLVE